MKIRLNVSIAGLDFAWAPGQEVDVADELGEALCADGRATPVAVKPVERAEKRAEKRTSKRKA